MITSHPRILLTVFVGVQLADGVLTACGLDRFGTAAEANPLVALGITLFGPVAALVVAKLVAIGGALMLYHVGRYTLLAVSTAIYLLVAILPWVVALTLAL